MVEVPGGLGPPAGWAVSGRTTPQLIMFADGLNVALEWVKKLIVDGHGWSAGLIGPAGGISCTGSRNSSANTVHWCTQGGSRMHEEIACRWPWWNCRVDWACQRDELYRVAQLPFFLEGHSFSCWPYDVSSCCLWKIDWGWVSDFKILRSKVLNKGVTL